MAEFDVIECGFNIADETINFGSRMLADGDQLFEACTLASIKQSDVTQKLSNVKILAYISNNKVCYAVNKNIAVFTDSTCTELCFNSSFDVYIDVFCIISSLKYLFVCLRNGTVLLLDIEEQEIIFNEELVSNDCLEEQFFIQCFTLEFSNSAMSFIVVTKSGHVYRITLEDVKKSCICLKHLIKDFQFAVKTAAMIYPYILVDGSKIAICNLETDDIMEEEPVNLLKVYPYSKEMFIGLDSEGNLLRICARTLFLFYINHSSKFRSFAYTTFDVNDCTTIPCCLCVTEENEIQLYNSYPGKLLLPNTLQSSSYDYLTKPMSINVCYVLVLSSLKFSLKTPDNVELICPENPSDEIMYTSIIERENVVEELRFQVILETSPEIRLKRLLRRQKFDEAERFAKQFNLSNTEILKARVQVIIDKTLCTEEDICNLLSILEEIDDVSFKLQSCIDTYQSCEKLSDVRKILNYGCNSITGHNLSRDISEMHDVISDILFRFDTFLLIQKQDNRNSDWLEFLNCDLIQLLCEYLQKFNIDAAIILYNRLDLDTKLKLNENSIDTIFNVLDNLPLNVYKPFLYCFIPLSLSYIPTMLPLFVKWLKRKVFFFEQHNFNEFPQNAIEFTNNALRLMKVDNGNINFQQQQTINREAIDDLSNLVKALKIVLLLKDSYQILVPLKEYLKGPKPLIHTLLTLDLNDDIFDKFLQDFLCKFMLENNLKPDVIFLEVIHNIVHYEESYWTAIVPSILRNIRSIEVKLTAVISLIEAADVPWSQTIRDIAKKSLEYEHTLVEVIKKEIEHEPIYRILKKPSYNLQDVKINDVWDIERVIGRIIYCNDSTMIDDIYQICAASEESRHTANIMLILHFVKTRNHKKALEILDNNSPEEILKCCKAVIRYIKFNDQFNLHKQNEPFLEILQCLQTRWNANNTSSYDTFEQSVHNILACSEIRTSLYGKIKIDDLECPKNKEILLNNLLFNISQDVCDKNLNALEAVESCKKIANLLSESKESTMIKFCEKVDNFKIIEECASYILNNEKNAKNLSLMATLILKSICPTPSAEDLLNMTSVMNDTIQESSTGIDSQIACLNIAQNLATRSILFAKQDEILACAEVLNWTMSTVYMTKEKSPIEKYLFTDTYFTNTSLPNPRSLYCLKHILSSYNSFIVSDINPDLRYLTYFESKVNELTKEEFLNKIQQLPMIIQNFCLEGQVLTAFKLITTFKNAMVHCKNCDAAITEILKSIMKNCTTQLIQKVFAAKHIDVELAYSLLLSYELKDCIAFLNRHLTIYRTEIPKFKTLAQLAVKILNYHEVKMNKGFYLEMIQRSNWWIRIPNCQLSLKLFFRSPKEQLLENLIHHQHVDLEMIRDFCKDFHLNVQNYYQIYLKKLLLNWKPEYTKVENMYGKVEINMKVTEAQLSKKCRDVVNLIENRESLYNFINGFRNEVNFYHYEVFLAIFRLLGDLNKAKDYKKKLLLLNFLKTYRRVNKPSDSETEEWYTLFPDTQNIDPLSQWRLPFTMSLFSFDIWKIIRPELNLQTYNTWFEAIPILDKILNKNEICSYVIKDVVSSGILQKYPSNDWVLHPIHDHLFEQIDICAKNMTNLEMATSAVYQLVMHTPKGADQVNAAKLCLKYAVQYKNSGPESDPAMLKAFIKVQKKYQSFAATHILHLRQIDPEKYVDMLLEPNELIDALYMDESILERAERVLLNCPDINNAVDDLGILFHINIHDIRLKLLENWLSEKVSSNFNLSCISNDINPITNAMDNSVNLKRAAYICQSEDVKVWQTHLLKIGLGEHESKKFYYMANALNCFIIISDVTTIEELTETSFEVFRNYVDKLYLLSDLEYLGLSLDVEALDNYKKTDLLKRLALDIYNPVTVKIMGDLSMTYVEYDPKFWQIIIKASIKLGLFHDLKKYVNFLKNEWSFKYKRFYIDAWQFVIDRVFDINNKNTEYVYNSCVENLLMIQSCPVLLSLNFSNVFNKCCNLRMYEFSAVIIQYFPKEKQDKYLERIIKCKSNLNVAVGELSKFGIWGTDLVQKLLETC